MIIVHHLSTIQYYVLESSTTLFIFSVCVEYSAYVSGRGWGRSRSWAGVAKRNPNSFMGIYARITIIINIACNTEILIHLFIHLIQMSCSKFYSRKHTYGKLHYQTFLCSLLFIFRYYFLLLLVVLNNLVWWAKYIMNFYL
jgi:hypothetical protein